MKDRLFTTLTSFALLLDGFLPDPEELRVPWVEGCIPADETGGAGAGVDAAISETGDLRACGLEPGGACMMIKA